MRMLDKFKRTLESPTLLSQAGALVGMGSALFVLPLMAAILPAQEIALWLYFSLFIGLGLMSDFGFGQALVRCSAYFMAGASEIPNESNPTAPSLASDPNRAGLESLLGTFLVCYRWIMLIALVVAGVIGALCSWRMISVSNSPIRGVAAGVFVWIGLGCSLRSAIWSNYLQGLGAVGLSKRIELIVGLARVLGYTIALMVNSGVCGLAFAGLCVSVWQYIWMRHKALARHRAVGCAWPIKFNFDPRLFAQVWPATWRQGIIGIGGYMITQAGALVSGSVRDAGLLAAYLFSLRLLGIARNLALAPIQVSVPLFVRLRAQGNYSGLKREFIARLAYCIFIATALSVFFWFAVGAYVKWAGKDLHLLPGEMFMFAALTGVLEVNHCAFSIFYITKNKVPFLAASLISGTAIAILSFLVVDRWSIWGLLIVQAVVQLAYNNWYPLYLVYKDMKQSGGNS